jgi:hypothetical protein
LLVSLAESFKKQLAERAKRQRKNSFAEYQVCNIIISHTEKSVLASSIADGINNIFKKSNANNATVEGVNARYLLESCHRSVVPAAVGSFLANIILFIKVSNKPETFRDEFAPYKENYWEHHSSVVNLYKTLRKQKKLNELRSIETSNSMNNIPPNNIPPNNIPPNNIPPNNIPPNNIPPNNILDVIIFDHTKAGIFSSDNSNYAKFFFIVNNIISEEEYSKLTIAIYNQYRIAITYKLLDTLIAMSVYKSDRLELSSNIPTSYINIIGDKLSPIPFNKCLYEVLLAQKILKRVPASGKTKHPTDTSRVGNTVFMPDKNLYLYKYYSNLPMISEPVNWTRSESGRISGGYYNTIPTSIYKFNVLTTKDYLNFSLHLTNELLVIMNRLQSIPFSINKYLLDWIISNYKMLVEKEILTHPGYSTVNFRELRRHVITNSKFVKEDFYRIDEELAGIKEDIAKATNETLVLSIAYTEILKYIRPRLLIFAVEYTERGCCMCRETR